MAKIIFTNDIGTTFRVYAGVDISSATLIQMKVKKPDGTSSTWAASAASDNSYYATYTTVSGDITIDGDWLLSLQITFVDGSFYQGESAEFTVYDQFEDIV